ncbi:MAG TPA: alpha/beta fold hydrolase [Burkholderiales bacterium]|nr:alpha/beta fold hydrolase [Burkholderiales bacterium]
MNKRSKQQLIIIGGFLFNQDPLQLLIDKLSNQYDIFFIDINLLNNALNSLDNLCKIIYEKIRHENKFRKTNLMGWSLGGLITLNLSILYPEQIEKVILLNSTPKFIAEDNWHGIKQKDFNNLYDKFVTMDIINFTKYFIRLVNYPHRHYNFCVERIGSILPNLSTKELINRLEILNSTDLRLQLLNTKVQILAIYGGSDILVPYNKLPCKQVIIDRLSHIVTKEYVNEVNKQIVEFLNDK